MRPLAAALAASLVASGFPGLALPPVALQAASAYGGFAFPVSFAFAPDGRVFVTEKGGSLKVVEGGTARVWTQLEVLADGEQGLLGLALDPDFAANGSVYVYYTDAGNGTNRVARLADENGVGTRLAVVVDGIPRADRHNGGVLAFAADGTLFVSTGDALREDAAQDRASLRGKVLRVRADGSVPPDNPFPGSLVYSYGHRNVFGLAVDPASGIAWVTENGPFRHDEVNRLEAGRNYGWPAVTGVAGRPDFVDPAYVFDIPSPALTQAVFYAGDGYEAENRGALFFGGWNSGAVYRAILTADRRGIAGVDVVHTFEGSGVVDVEAGPDGKLYAAVVRHDGSGGTIFVLESLPPVGAGREQHVLAAGALVAVLAGLLVAYAWKRRRLSGRERS